MNLNVVMYMFRSIIFILLFLSLNNIKGLSQNRIKWLSHSSVESNEDNTEKYYLIYFYYNDCKWCKQLESKTFTDNHTARFINQNFYPVKINAVTEDKIVFDNKVYKSVNVGKFDFNQLAVELLNGKMSFPSIVVLDKEMKKIGVHQNYYNVDDFQMILAYYAGGYYKTTLFKYYSNNYCKDSHFYNLVSDR